MTTFPFLIRGPTRRLRIAHVEASSYNSALDKVLSVHPNKFVKTKHAKAMVLIEAKVAAQKESKAQKGKTVYIYSDNKSGEVDITLQEKTNGKFTTLTSYVNGKEVKVVRASEQIMEEAAVIENKSKSLNKTAAADSATTMKAKKNGKKATAKKAVKVSADWGKQVSISIKDMRAGIKKGFQYRDAQGVIQSEKYMATRSRQDHVREGIYVQKLK